MGSLGGRDWWMLKLGGNADVTPPTAMAGMDQTVRTGTMVTLDGSASFDDNTDSMDLGYFWTFVSTPTGSAATLTNPNTPTPSFLVDLPGTYEVQLVVTDEAGLNSAPARVICSSANLAPTAVARVNFNFVILGDTAHLDGSASTDPDVDPLSYSWSITAKPSGSGAILVGATEAFASLAPDKEGLYEATLVVSDFIGPSAPSSVQFTAISVLHSIELQIVRADTLVANLTPWQVTTRGNQTALGNFLTQAIAALRIGDRMTAVAKLQNALERTDGCALRGSPDGSGPGRDWIVDYALQIEAYSLLSAALSALTIP